MANEVIEVERISDLAEGQYNDDSWLVIDTGTVVVKLKLKDAVPDASTSVKGKVQLSDSTDNDSSHVAATSKAVKSVKDALTLASEALSAAISGKYSKPSSGIPKSDLDSSVQQSLDNGDTALSTLQSIGKPLVWHGPADVETLNGTISGLDAGWSYTLTDSGTLTAGSVSVDVGDEVAWTGSAWFKLGGDGGIKAFAVRYSTDTEDYVYPTYTELSSAVSAGKMPVILQYVYNSPLRYCFVFRWLSGGYIRFDNNSRYIEISNSNTANWGYINDKNLAADYDPTATYDAGDYCVYHNELFVCTTVITVAEEWNSSHWQRTSMSDIVGNVEALLSAL